MKLLYISIDRIETVVLELTFNSMSGVATGKFKKVGAGGWSAFSGLVFSDVMANNNTSTWTTSSSWGTSPGYGSTYTPGNYPWNNFFNMNSYRCWNQNYYTVLSGKYYGDLYIKYSWTTDNGYNYWETFGWGVLSDGVPVSTTKLSGTALSIQWAKTLSGDVGYWCSVSGEATIFFKYIQGGYCAYQDHGLVRVCINKIVVNYVTSGGSF